MGLLVRPQSGVIVGRCSLGVRALARVSSSPEGDAPKRKRRPMSEETKQKIAAALRGKRTQSQETRERISEAMSNRSLSLTHRLRISESRRGHSHSPETRKTIGEAVHATKRRKKKERLADRAAREAVAATVRSFQPADPKPSVAKLDCDTRPL